VPSSAVRSSVDACLEKIDRRDPTLRAWVYIDREGARRTADSLDADAGAGRARGPLQGIVVALKDIFDAAGMATTSGAPPFAHRHPERDAPAVAALRTAGAVILGKTVTTEFAFADPSITRNPWNLEHTPGGSSSGSAAAVAAGMAQVALGSQTIGSTIRPAGYCGVVGFKGTYGRISTEGVTPLSWSLDHVGIFTKRVDDVARVFSVLAAELAAPPPSAPLPSASRHSPSLPHWASPPRISPPRFSIPRVWVDSIAAPDVRAHLDMVAELLRRAGATVEDVILPPSAARIEADGRLVLRVEAAAYHSRWFSAHAAEYAPRIRELIESGLQVPATDYIRAHEARYQFRREMAAIFDQCDALLLLSAPAPAPPLSENTTGDPVFCAPWSFAGFPSIALPSGLTPGGLPLSIQLVGPVAADAQLLETARWCEGRLAFSAAPPR
jgi:aspartyl-tRNA(Asn)/glutamyl-tRNA(Gln) amidotransferase subunit A